MMLTSERVNEVTKMIATIQKKHDCSEKAAIEHILRVGTGKLISLARYKKTLPPGKRNKHILTITSPAAAKRLAKKSPKLTPKAAAAVEAASAVKPKRKTAKRKPAKRKAKAEEHLAHDPRQLALTAAE